MPEIDIIEPFRQGVMVQFAHKLGNAFSDSMEQCRVVGSTGFELEQLTRKYEFIEAFDIERDDRASGLSKNSPIAKLGRSFKKIRVLKQFLAQYDRAINGVIERQPTYSLMATIFRYPRMTHFLAKLRNAGVRPLQICHEYQLREEKKSLQARLTHQLNSNAYQHMHSIFFLSEGQREGFASAFPKVERKRLFVIPCGNGEVFKEVRTLESDANVAQRYGIDTNRKLVLFFGRIRPDKGVEDLIQAFSHLTKKQKIQPQLMLAGHATPEFLKQLRLQIDTLGLSKAITIYPDYIDSKDVWPLHCLANATVFPYRSSSQSAAVQTAMACEKPIIVSNVGGLAETITDGVTGLVVPSRDPAELANAIDRVLNDQESAQNLGTAAGQLSRTKYAWETIAAEMAAAAESLH